MKGLFSKFIILSYSFKHMYCLYTKNAKQSRSQAIKAIKDTYKSYRCFRMFTFDYSIGVCQTHYSAQESTVGFFASQMYLCKLFQSQQNISSGNGALTGHRNVVLQAAWENRMCCDCQDFMSMLYQPMAQGILC